MHSNSSARSLRLTSLLAFLACLLFGALSLVDRMNDPGLPLAALICLAWSYLASVWADGQPLSVGARGAPGWMPGRRSGMPAGSRHHG